MTTTKERKLKILIEYDGTEYSGWQIQPDVPTIQKEVEDALSKILCQPIRIYAAGRTDAGVHASGQMIDFRTTSSIETGRLKCAMNGILPKDISIIDISDADWDFSARFNAVSRTYRYTISDRKLSIGRNYAWHVKYPLSRELLEASTKALCGRVNLKGFSKSPSADANGEIPPEDFETFIIKNSWTFNENFMIFEISAIRFFHHAVRSIVGTAVEIARLKKKGTPYTDQYTLDLTQKILETGDRSLAGPTAPAKGLCLYNVGY